MSRPGEFVQNFDWKYTRNAKQLAERDSESYAEYLGK